MEASKFNQTMFKGLLYLFILMFAYQCASNPTPQTNKGENKSRIEKESYIDDLVSGNNYSSDSLEKKVTKLKTVIFLFTTQLLRNQIKMKTKV